MNIIGTDISSVKIVFDNSYWSSIIESNAIHTNQWNIIKNSIFFTSGQLSWFYFFRLWFILFSLFLFIDINQPWWFCGSFDNRTITWVLCSTCFTTWEYLEWRHTQKNYICPLFQNIRINHENANSANKMYLSKLLSGPLISITYSIA